MPMKCIQVYDPPMCCSTGICGPNVDPDLVNFAAMLSQFKAQGVTIERYNLGQQPLAFAQNPVIKTALEVEGPEALPIILWDGAIHLKGRYPTKLERPDWFHAVFGKQEASS